MPVTRASGAGSIPAWNPRSGLRALADAINDALAAMGTPAMAVVTSQGSFTVRRRDLRNEMAIDLGAGALPLGREATLPSTGARHSRNGTEPDEPAEPDEPDYLDEGHSETWSLVHRAQGGDGDAFGLLYDRYVDTVFRFIYFRVNDRALAEDFTSETFLRALRRITTISYQGRDIGAWFITIARNIVLDHMKSARHRLEITTADTYEGDDREPSTEEAVLGGLQSEHLMAAVRQLGDEQRECVMLRFIQGFSVSETAAVMGKNDGAIKALQHRAVRKLAELVSGDYR
jgi:RNA polymerase sigma-70 factor (ECF subfamily)